MAGREGCAYPLPMLRAEPGTPHLPPREKAWVELFNAVHSPGAFLMGVDFAAVLPKRPASLPPEHEGQRYAALSWPGRRQPYLVPIEELMAKQGRLLKGLLKGVRPEDVALATPKLPAEIWRFLNERGYFREIDHQRQQEGWLSESEQDARWYLEHQPDFDASAALLPRKGQDGIVGVECLLLVQVNYQWHVLSEVGAHGRAGGSELLRGEKAWFVTSRPRWSGYTVRIERKVNADEVGFAWGLKARERARGDVPSLVVVAEPWGG